MALVQCYECDARISDLAASCPHCGAPAKTSTEPSLVQLSTSIGLSSNASVQANQTVQAPPLPEAEMLQLGITKDGNKFRYKTDFFWNVNSAIEYARTDQKLPKLPNHAADSSLPPIAASPHKMDNYSNPKVIAVSSERPTTKTAMSETNITHNRGEVAEDKIQYGSSSSWDWVWPSIVALIIMKLFGVVGGLVTFGSYFWLKPKTGTWGAVAISGVLGLIVAVGLLAMLR